MENKEVKKRKIKTIVIIESFLAIFFVLIIAAGITAYFFSPSKESFLGKVLDKFSYPVFVIDGSNFIYSGEVKGNLDILRKFYESEDVSRSGSRVDFTTDEGKKRLKVKEKEVINKEIENKIIETLAKKRGIRLSNSDVDKYFDRKISEDNFLGKSLNDFALLYGWGAEKIKKEIIIPQIYTERLKASVSKEIDTNEKSLEVIELAKKELEKGTDFSAVVKSYSEGHSVNQDGNIGWIAKDQLIPEVSDKVFSDKTELTGNYEIIESSLGYHIIKVEEMKKEDGVDLVNISQIFTRKKTFSDWLNNETKNMNIKSLNKEYYWDKNEGFAEFSDDSMQVFEKNMRENSEGDISISK